MKPPSFTYCLLSEHCILNSYIKTSYSLTGSIQSTLKKWNPNLDLTLIPSLPSDIPRGSFTVLAGDLMQIFRLSPLPRSLVSPRFEITSPE